ncbi:MFS transporter [Neobacillus niacini]|uniref:MFS transporter n=1 Tax=Neobacillus niacini TaxID=86668 RepID=UPI00203F1D0B|nr:MFS transporter [Neobacillus niacini]MCM3693691.1 MFS transporter [Neobacillus niacini]
MSNAIVENKNQYNTAKLWQIGFFALNNTATNLYMFALGFISYYAAGIAGVAVVAVSTILTFMRIWDSVTDPIIGFIIDKTESKLGKFRPMMIIGQVIMASTVILMYNVTHLVPDGFTLIFFILIYGVYIIGYTFQTAVTKAAQTVLTNDPKQRPVFAVFDATYNIALFTLGQIAVASYLVPKHGGFNKIGLFIELNTYAIVGSAVFTFLAIIGIWAKDRKEFFGLAEQTVQTKFRDYWPIFKGNRPLQMLTIAASTDKLAGSIVRHPAVLVMFFGLMIGDYALSGTLGLVTLIPTLLVTFVGIGIARKRGLKRTFVGGTWLALISFAILSVFMLMIDPKDISLSNIGVVTVIFLILYGAGIGFGSLTGNMVIPMIADCSDYETYRTGRYVPGMLGTIFSFVDKMISSLAATIVGFMVAMIGFKEDFPQLDDTFTTQLLIMTMILKFGFPILGWIASIIAMKFYDLDDAKMAEIQKSIADIKAKASKDKAAV